MRAKILRDMDDLTPCQIDALRHMCAEMKKSNDFKTVGLFVSGSMYNKYAMIMVNGFRGDVESLARQYNTKKRYSNFRIEGFSTLYGKEISDSFASEFIEKVSGDFCNVNTRYIITFEP